MKNTLFMLAITYLQITRGYNHNELYELFSKLSLVVAQGQKYETPSENQTHNGLLI